ncbi:hypothetical protein SASPL_148457 [Salvia splendens]|uniref:BED-type domain-containing protein n=1 Tax=Salvia splendens TaxID=180675 RepID=A0A8X8WAP6_SALSN|nr:hypothetical protein SASPL_148457 [Salvia splendens]
MSNIITDGNQQVKDDEILKDIEDKEEARTEAPSPSRKRKRGKVPSKRKSTSVHWNNYDKMMVEEGNPPVARTKAKCKECGTLIAADAWNGTNGLKNHTISCLKKKADAEVGSGPPEEEDWVNVKKMVSYLKKFHSFTQIVSVTKKPTSHLFFAEMCGIFDLIRRLEMNNDKEVSSMASKMKLKIGKYWLEETELNVKMNKILYIAAILDPRKKMKHVETARYAPRPPSRSSVDATIEDTSDEEDSYNMFGMDISDDDGDSSNQTELDIYLTVRRHKVPKEEMASFDLLKWWSEHSHYHVLSEMARDILAIPVSSVASESAFSMGGRVLSPYRSSLTCTMVEALICAGDWLKTSDLDKKEEEDVDEEEQEKEYHGAMAPTSARLTLMPNEG